MTFFAHSNQEYDSVTKAEVLFANFVTLHNLTASVADHFSDLAAEIMFPDK